MAISNGFTYIDLNSGEAIRTERRTGGIRESLQGLAVLVLPFLYLRDKWTQDLRPAPLRALCGGLEEKPFPSEDWVPQDGTYLRFTKGRHTHIDRLCQTLVRPPGMDGVCLVFLHAAAFRQVHDRVRYSATVLPSFLLCYHGALRHNEGTGPATSLQPEDAWVGGGWLSLDQATQCPEVSLQCFDRLASQIDDQCRGLCERHLLGKVEYAHGQPPAVEIARKQRQVARILCGYLPRFRESPNTTQWRHYGADAPNGRLPLHGPVPWRNWNDQRLGELEQDLVFEGWLTPFTDSSNRWTLQPASLILLFWAARVMDLPFTEDPEQFIMHHDWQGWFGNRCHWQSNPPSTGQSDS